MLPGKALVATLADKEEDNERRDTVDERLMIIMMLLRAVVSEEVAKELRAIIRDGIDYDEI